MILHDDGNLCIYREGTTAPVWSSGHIDPVTAIHLNQIEYHKPDVPPPPDIIIQVDRKVLVNETSTEQIETFLYKKTVKDTIGWSHTSGLTEGAKISVNAKLPLSISADIGMSTEFHETSAWNGEATKETDWSFEEPVKLKPHSAITAVIEATVTTITVPYTLTGRFFFQSGREVNGHTHGVYTGTHTHDLTVKYVESSTATEVPALSKPWAEPPRIVYPKKQEPVQKDKS
jgi:hypothetical protein